MASTRILIVTHSFTPQQNPRALRWGSIAQHWSDQGIVVDVVTAARPGLPIFETRSGLTIYRVGNRLIEKLRARFLGSRGASSDRAKSQSASMAGKLLRAFHNHTWKQIYWPDYAWLWIRPAARLVQQLLDRYEYTAVISVSEPYSAHLAVRQAMEQSVPNRWVVDISDPFSTRELAVPNNTALYSKRNHRIESEILSLCSAASVTTDETAAEYKRHFPQIAGKIQVIGPLMSSAGEIDSAAPRDSVRFGKKLVFVGTLYADLRSPVSVIRHMLELLKRPAFEYTELHFYGGCVGSRQLFDPAKDFLNKNIFVHGTVARKEVLAAMLDADVLVNIGNRSTVQLPSKIVEYIWAGKPIWNLASVPDDCAASYLNGYPNLLNQIGAEGIPSPQQTNELAEFLISSPFRIPEEHLTLWKTRSSITTIAGDYARICGISESATPGSPANEAHVIEQEVTLTLG